MSRLGSKEAFNFCVSCNFDSNKIKVLADSLDTTISRIRQSARFHSDIVEPNELENYYNALKTEQRTLFNLYISLNGDDEAFKEYLGSGYTFSTAIKKIREYVKTASEKERKIYSRVTDSYKTTKPKLSPVDYILNGLLKQATEEDIIVFLDNSLFTVNPDSLIFALKLRNYEQEEHLIEILKAYNKLLRSRANKKNEIERKYELIASKSKHLIVDSNNHIKRIIELKPQSLYIYLKEQEISLENHKLLVEVARIYSPNLYSSFTEYMNHFDEIKNSNNIKRAKRMVYLITNGVEDNRPFDIIDYKNLFKISFSELLNIIKEHLTEEEYNIIREFIEKHIETTFYNKDEVETEIVTILTDLKLPLETSSITAAKRRKPGNLQKK